LFRTGKGGAGLFVPSPDDFSRGSVERAKSITIGLVSAWNLAATTEKNWLLEVERARKEAAHKKLGFKDFDTYLMAAIGKTEDEAKERFKTQPTKQGERCDLCKLQKSTQAGRAKENCVGVRTQTYLDRLARDRPDLLAEVQAGRLKPYAAARQAGIVKVPTRLERMFRCWAKMTPAVGRGRRSQAKRRGLTMSEEGGLEEVEESLRAEASCS
jgi:hypothetical protein